MEECIVELESVYKSYEHKVILCDVNLKIFKNEAIAITGPNGVGKSTLLKVIAGLTKINRGKRVINKKGRIKIGYVPEIFPKHEFTPIQYLNYMGKIQGLSSEYIEKRLDMLFRLFNINIYKDASIANLSKGTVQKVSVIQAFLSNSDVVILDEPLSGQDELSQKNFVDLIINCKKQGVAVVLACHEKYLVELVADRVINIYEGSINVFDHIRNSYIIIEFSLNKMINLSALNNINVILHMVVEGNYGYVHVLEQHSNRVIIDLIRLGLYIVSVRKKNGSKFNGSKFN
jgi:ABC-type multidrug transport system ATPase subunit